MVVADLIRVMMADIYVTFDRYGFQYDKQLVVQQQKMGSNDGVLKILANHSVDLKRLQENF